MSVISTARQLILSLELFLNAAGGGEGLKGKVGGEGFTARFAPSITRLVSLAWSTSHPTQNTK